MTATARTGGLLAGRGPVGQHHSHARLRRDVSRLPAPPVSSRAGRLDAVVIPATRPVSFQRAAIELAADLGCLAILLCSGRVAADQVAELAKRIPGSRVLAVDVPRALDHELLPRETAAARFREAAAGRSSDLSLKRNLGLLLARMLGWSKIVFVDDDISFPRSATDGLRRLAAQLEHHRVVGMSCAQFPDNSVVCHARRLAGLPQDVFVTGAVLGVHCSDLPIPFFPDVYNEDWFSFAELAARRELRQVGQAIQAEYNPYQSVQRAQQEEFGDLLAEGLYSLFDQQGPDLTFTERLAEASESFWARFQEDRAEQIQLIRNRLQRSIDQDSCDERGKLAAYFALETAAHQLKSIQPATCVDFLAAWSEDLRSWNRKVQRITSVGGIGEALSELGLSDWRIAEFGNPWADLTPMPFALSDRNP